MEKKSWTTSDFGFLVLASAVFCFTTVAAADTLRVQGSTTVNPVVTEALEILEREQGLRYRIDTLGGSAGGINGVGGGQADVGMTSRKVSDADQARFASAELYETTIGIDAVALVVPPNVWHGGIQSISQEQMRGIYERRTRIGMLFQQPAVFPVSIAENVLFGARRIKRLDRNERESLVERSLKEAFPWDELKDRLKEPGLHLSVGQQQRLCLARTLALDPPMILMDEPTSALDSRSTRAIEELILRLSGSRTVILVTHDLAQARRVTDRDGSESRRVWEWVRMFTASAPVLGVFMIETASRRPRFAVIAVVGKAVGILQHPRHVHQVPSHNRGVKKFN